MLGEYIDWSVVNDFMTSNARDLFKEHFDNISTTIKEKADKPAKKPWGWLVRRKQNDLRHFVDSIDKFLGNEDYASLLQLALIIKTKRLVDHYNVPLKRSKLKQADFTYFFERITEHIPDPRIIFPWSVLFLLMCGDFLKQFANWSGYFQDRYIGLFVGIDMELDSIMLVDAGDDHSRLLTRDNKYWVDGRLINYDRDGNMLCPDCGAVVEKINN